LRKSDFCVGFYNMVDSTLHGYFADLFGASLL
jgi:hypothetical protein